MLQELARIFKDMDRYNRNAIAELFARIGITALLIALALLVMSFLTDLITKV